MSLDVSPDLLEDAERGEVDEAAFVECIRVSLPYAWETISLLVAERDADPSGRPFVDNQVPPPDERARGQLLRALASDAIRRLPGAPLRRDARLPELPPGRRLPARRGPRRGPPQVRVTPGSDPQPVARAPRLLTTDSRAWWGSVLLRCEPRALVRTLFRASPSAACRRRPPDQ